MERIIENCVEKYSFHFVNGAFSKKFFEIASDLKKEPSKYEVDYGHGFDFKKIKIPKRTELICFTHNETSTGVALEVKEIQKFKKIYPDKLIAVDIVSSVPYVNLNFSLLDIVFFSVQKGFGLPAGLGVLILSPQALKKSEYLFNKKINIGSYHKFIDLLSSAQKNQTPETPNVLAIYLLGKVIKDMNKKGLDKIRQETDLKAELLFNFLNNNKYFNNFVREKPVRSKTVIACETKIESQKVIEKLKKKGYIVGSGYGIYKKNQIRIANFPALSIQSIKGLIKQLSQLSI
jgi:phosphoserine aminotransferase